MWANRSCSTNPLAEQNTLLSDTRAPQLEQEQRGKRETCPLRKKKKPNNNFISYKRGLARTSLAHRSQTLERPRRRERRNHKDLSCILRMQKGVSWPAGSRREADFIFLFSGICSLLGFRSIIRPWIRLFNQLPLCARTAGIPPCWSALSRVPAR